LAAFLGAAIIGAGAPGTARAQDPAILTIHDYRAAVPVLCYHGVYTGSRAAGDGYSLPLAQFERHMAMLSAEGFHPISIDQYAAFATGDATALPDRPVLITFDDGRLDSLTNADPVLARYGMRATMFVITTYASGPKPGYLGWPALRAMAASGRWDLQLHAHAGHVNVATGPGGRTGPFYANLLYRNGVREKFTAFKRRVTADILEGRRVMAAQVPGFRPITLALPYGNYGQVRSNYEPIADWELGWLQSSFAAVFVQDHRVYNLPGARLSQRFGMRSATTATALRQWLGLALPRSAWLPDAAPIEQRARPRRPALRWVHRGRGAISMALRVRRGVSLRASRRRAGRRHAVPVRVTRSGRLRDRGLRPRTAYIYRITAADRAGDRSRALRLRLRTR
jgi:peptidoglycan/xylan/chitin deacetylase (PgdA/CDA1 family)